MKKIKNCERGFTLLELLVVVLIIGILAGIALPQYKMAVTKAKVASILPLMRRFKDALMEYKLQHGSYCKDNDCEEWPDASDIGVNWPSDWTSFGDEACGDSVECWSNDGFWASCFANEEQDGKISCTHDITSRSNFTIMIYQSDDPNENFRNKITCYAYGAEAHKICKALGGKLAEEDGDEYILY